MKQFVRKILKEHTIKYDTTKLIKDYVGDNKFLLNLKSKLNSGWSLTQKQTEAAIKILKNHFYSNTIAKRIVDSKQLIKLVKKEGIKVYLNLVKTKKKGFITKHNKNITIDTPSKEWIQQNIIDLINFKNKLHSKIEGNNNKFEFEGREEKITISQEINRLLVDLKNNEIYAFVEITEDAKKNWSILNKVDTNYSNWARLIAKRDLKGHLKGNTDQQKVLDYFTQKPLEDIIPGFEELRENEKWTLIQISPFLSLAEWDIIEPFLEHFIENPEQLTATDTFENILQRLRNTTEKGNQSENDFKVWLGSKNVEIYDFSTPGNLVDITFQTDILVSINGEWIPIQVKSKDSFSKLLNYNIGGLVVYPTKSEFVSTEGPWSYKQKGDPYGKSFEKDFFKK